MRGGADPKLGNRPDVLAVEGSGATQATSAGSAAKKTRAAAVRVDARAIAVSVEGVAAREQRPGPDRSGRKAVPTGTP
jgi:hypothetical protein